MKNWISILKKKLLKKMANTLSVMTNVLRNVVSKQRIRYKEKGFNLDLAYICENIIAMGYPADNIEKIYRNRLEDVYKFLEENHCNHYKIYNLCLERSYDIDKFHKRVAAYPFEDHNPPTIELIISFCRDVDSWLKSNENNVAAVHCKAGKGRTGTMICCYLLYSGFQQNAEDALAFYDEKRTKDRKGVTIPSQRRYVQYFSKLINCGLSYEKKIVKLCEIRLSQISHTLNQGPVNCTISELHGPSCQPKLQLVHSAPIDFRKVSVIYFENTDLVISGDVKIEFSHKTSKKSLFHFWFNTYFVSDHKGDLNDQECRGFTYTLHKSEIDDAHKDKEHKIFSEDFKIQMVLSCDSHTYVESDKKDFQIFFNDGKSERSLTYDLSQTSLTDAKRSFLEQSTSPEKETEKSLNKLHFCKKENFKCHVDSNCKFSKGISSYKTLDRTNHVHIKSNCQEQRQEISHELEIQLHHSQVSEIKDIDKQFTQPSSQNDNLSTDSRSNSNSVQYKSNISSNLSNNSIKQCIFEDDWESGP